MTRSIETEVEIAVSPDSVWAVLADYPGYSDWNPYIVRIEGEARAGTTIVVHAKPNPGAVALASPVDVVAVEPPRTMRWEGGLPDRRLWRGDHWWTVEPRGTSALLRHFEYFSGELADAILAEHGETIRTNFHRFNDALKARVERLA